MSGATAKETREVPMFEGGDRRRGLGELRITGEARPALPLAGVSIRARVAERVADVEIEQRFHNPYAEPLEATYIFPLGGGSAVSRLELQVGDRILRGKVDERAQAQRDYRRAIEEGKRAALLEQERDDVFTVQVGNLPPGEEVTVRLAYAEKLPYFDDGMTELRLPLVVAPRYIAGQVIDTTEQAGRGTAADTDQVPDASRITPPRLAPGFDPKVALRLHIQLLHGSAGGVADLLCSQHATRSSMTPEVMNVSLASNQEPLDRDFVLRWRLAGEKLASTLLVHRGAGGEGHGLLSLVPPLRDGALAARDVVFVVDRSGSMEGQKIASAARACSMLLNTLGPGDRFAIQAFDNAVEWLDGAARFTAADEGGIARGDKWLRTIEARGGTEIEAALAEALAAVRARTDVARAPVMVLLTDGEIGDEGHVLARIQRELGQARIFSVGIDTAVNSGFLRRLAQLARGTATLVEPGVQLEDALRKVAREIGQPLVVDLQVDDVDAGLIAASAAPERMPDLFAGRAASCAFRFARGAAARGSVRVRGRCADGSRFEQIVELREIGMPALGQLWARARVSDLEDRFRMEPQRQADLKKEIVELARRHTLLTRFTAFVVIDESEIANRTGARREVTQPVAMPAGWSDELAGSGAMPMRGPMRALAAPVVARATGRGATRGPSVSKAMSMAPPSNRYKRQQRDLDDTLEPSFPAMGDFEASAALPEQQIAFDEEVAPELESQPSKSAAMPPDAAISPEERRDLRVAFTALVTAVKRARNELAAGRLPATAELESARDQVLQMLARPAVARHVPTLDRYLRTSLSALIGALAGGDAAAAAELVEKHQPELDAASREIDAPAGAPRPPYWEASI